MIINLCLVGHFGHWCSFRYIFPLVWTTRIFLLHSNSTNHIDKQAENQNISYWVSCILPSKGIIVSFSERFLTFLHNFIKVQNYSNLTFSKFKEKIRTLTQSHIRGPVFIVWCWTDFVYILNFTIVILRSPKTPSESAHTKR